VLLSMFSCASGCVKLYDFLQVLLNHMCCVIIGKPILRVDSYLYGSFIDFALN